MLAIVVGLLLALRSRRQEAGRARLLDAARGSSTGVSEHHLNGMSGLSVDGLTVDPGDLLELGARGASLACPRCL
jgi:hypothetical protein